jgi:hypothetical protein
MSKDVAVEELNQAIMDAIGNRQLKVIRVASEVRDKTSLELEDIVQRLCDLIEDGILEGFGDLNKWRHSEVRKKIFSSPSSPLPPISKTALEAVNQPPSSAREPNELSELAAIPKIFSRMCCTMADSRLDFSDAPVSRGLALTGRNYNSGEWLFIAD